jgi:hypothetical protein
MKICIWTDFNGNLNKFPLPTVVMAEKSNQLPETKTFKLTGSTSN